MTQVPATRTPPPAPGAGIDLKTLWITAVSSAAAAYVTSKVWAPGTLAAAAFTPVLVAVIREGLAKSTDVVVKAVPVKGVVRSARPEGPHGPDADETQAGFSAEDLESSQAPLLADDPAARVAQPGEISYHTTAGTRARNWRVAIITGLLGFVIAAVVFTVPELVAGNSAAGNGRGTTLFGGQERDSRTPAVTTTTQTAPAKTVTTAPQQTVTAPPETVTTPEPEATVPEPEEEEVPPPPATTTPPPPAAEPPPPGEVPPG